MRPLSLALLLSLFISTPAFAEQFTSAGTTDVYFSPNGGANQTVEVMITVVRLHFSRGF